MPRRRGDFNSSGPNLRFRLPFPAKRIHTSCMKDESILVIVTGGTFDKHYDEIRGELTFKETHLPEILKQVRVTLPIRVETNQLIDSLQMQDENRASVLEACRAAGWMIPTS